MVGVTSIIGMSPGVKPTLESLMAVLRDLSKPIATEHRPIPIIAPAVMKLHDQTYTFEYELGQQSLKDKAQANLIRMKFDDITDSYVIVLGIEAADNPLDGILLTMEKTYGEKVVGVLYRIVDQAGMWGYTTSVGTLSLETRKAFVEELGRLRKEHPTPGFALDDGMIRRGSMLGALGWLLFLLFVLAQTPLSAVIIHLIINFLQGPH